MVFEDRHFRLEVVADLLFWFWTDFVHTYITKQIRIVGALPE